MDGKRHEHPTAGEGPLLKIRKIVNLSPGAKKLLKSKESFTDGQLLVRQQGDEVFLSLRAGEGNVVNNVPVPRQQSRPVIQIRQSLQRQQPIQDPMLQWQQQFQDMPRQQQQPRQRPIRAPAGR